MYQQKKSKKRLSPLTGFTRGLVEAATSTQRGSAHSCMLVRQPSFPKGLQRNGQL